MCVCVLLVSLTSYCHLFVCLQLIALCCMSFCLLSVVCLFVGMFTLFVTCLFVCLFVRLDVIYILHSLERDRLMGQSLSGQLPQPNV